MLCLFWSSASRKNV